MLEESEEVWVTQGEDVCWGTVKATLNEERRKVREDCRRPGKGSNFIPLGWNLYS